MFPAIPPVTRALIVACVAMFGVEYGVGDPVIAYFALWPVGTPPAYTGALGFQPWQVVSYSFLHGGLGHLAFNMFALYMFGGNLERLFGPRRYLNLYFVSVVVAAIAQLIVAGVADGEPYPTVGASG